jgi:hypothetical protein
MIHLICCMKSQLSYNRIVSQFKDKASVEFEIYTNELEQVQERIVFSDYDLAIIDEKLWWKKDGEELFRKKDIDIILFQGDFEEIINQIKEVIEEKEEEEEVLVASTLVNKIIEPKITEVTTTIKYIEIPIEKKEIVYQKLYVGIQNQLIVVLDLSKRAGSTFFTLNFSKYLASLNILVNVIEPPIEKPYIFDSINLEKRIGLDDNGNHKEFYSYPHVISLNNKIEKNKELIESGIVWLIPDARKPIIENWNYAKMMKLIYASKKANISIIDCGNNFDNESVQEIISEADLILTIVDPLPVECMQNNYKLDELLKLKQSGLNVEFIINNFNSGVDKEELNNFLEIEPIAYIPSLDKALIYKAIYEGEIPYSYEEIKKHLNKPFFSLAKIIIPRELLHFKPEINEKTKTNILGKLQGMVKRKEKK